MAATTRGVILVGHGGIPKGCPQELVTKLKRLEGQRRAAKMPASAEEIELDTKIRVPINPQDTTFFLSRINWLATPKPGMALWREHLFVFLSRNSRRTSSFFGIPSEQTVEIGIVVDI